MSITPVGAVDAIEPVAATNSSRASATRAPTTSTANTSASTPSASTDVSLSDSGKAFAAAEAAGLTVTQESLGQYFAPTLFQRADTNGDGTLSQTEFTALAQGGGDTSAQASTLFQSVDSNHDGAVSPAEFLQGTIDSANAGDQTFRNVADALLHNPDGSINVAAFAQMAYQANTDKSF
jgi:hypothetical protein